MRKLKKQKKSTNKSMKKVKAVTKVPKIVKNSIGVMPAGDRVLVCRTEPETKTASGILIPDTTKEKSEEGVVVAVGPGKKNNEGKVIPLSFSVGERVRFSYGDEFKKDGIEYVLVHEDNIVAVITK